MTGRPRSYTEEIAATICERLADGLSLVEICRGDGMPDKSTVFRWLASDASFRDRYAQARVAQADHYADEIVEISDNASNDWMVRNNGEDEVVVPNHDHIARSRLRVDSRKWLMSKLAPKKYGDKIDLEHSGAVQISRIEHVIVKPT